MINFDCDAGNQKKIEDENEDENENETELINANTSDGNAWHLMYAPQQTD